MNQTELKEYNNGVVRGIEYIKSKYRDSLENMGNAYYRDAILPLEKKHNLKFLSGNGDWVFVHVPTDITIHPVDVQLYGIANLACDGILSTELCDELTPVFDVCGTELAYNDFFGYYIG